MLREARLSRAPVLDMQLRYRHSSSQSPYVFQVSQAIALHPLIRAKTKQDGGAIGWQAPRHTRKRNTPENVGA